MCCVLFLYLKIFQCLGDFGILWDIEFSDVFCCRRVFCLTILFLSQLVVVVIE